MKKFICLLAFLISIQMTSQVFNSKSYCVDEKPFSLEKDHCDFSGEEYAFVEIEKESVTFFLIDLEMKYSIVSVKDNVQEGWKTYILKNDYGQIVMKKKTDGSKITFKYPSSFITITVGESKKYE